MQRTAEKCIYISPRKLIQSDHIKVDISDIQIKTKPIQEVEYTDQSFLSKYLWLCNITFQIQIEQLDTSTNIKANIAKQPLVCRTPHPG